MKTKALFKQVVKFEQFDPLWFILGENKGGPYCCKIEITRFWRVLKTSTTLQELKIPKSKDLGQYSPSCLIGRIRKDPDLGVLRRNPVRPSVTFLVHLLPQ